MREFLKGLELDKETIDSIMAEYGKNVQSYKEAKEDAESKLKSIEENSKTQTDWKSKYEELDGQIKQQEAENKAKEEDEALTNTILASIGDKKFTSDYVKTGILADVKSELKKQENIGKGVDKIVEELTKDKEGIFVNPNINPEIPPMGTGEEQTNKETPLLW